MPTVQPADRTCGTCGETGGGGHIALITPGRNGNHYEVVPCPACGTTKTRTKP